MRQHFAQAYMKIDFDKQTIINIDESWCGETDFRRMGWCRMGRSNSVPKKQVVPRISLITALSSSGMVLVALS